MAVDLWAYGDESGTDEREWHTVVGGFISTPKHWDSFNTEWRKVLDWAEVNEFHAKWFFNRCYPVRKNPYREWKEPKAAEFLRRLLLVVQQHPRVEPIASVLDNRQFWSHSWGDRAFLTGGQWDNVAKRYKTPGQPNRTYVVPFFMMLGDALDKAQDGTKVHVIMDENKVVKGVLDTYLRFRNGRSTLEQRGKMGNLIPGMSHVHEGIQAADMFAYLTYSAFKLDRTKDRFSGERLEAARAIFDRHKYEPPSIKERALDFVLTNALSPEDRELVRVFEPHRKEKKPWSRGF